MTSRQSGAPAALVRVPVSTYRLQLNAGFPFAKAAEASSYAAKLGATDLYLSPSFKAAPGSPHGYDICDHQQLNPELGGDPDFHALALYLRQSDMGILLDFVPNHMGADPMANPWWRDVLENGPSSPYARFFDIDWHPIKAELFNKVLLPVLGDQYGRVLERGELQVRFDNGAFVLHYFEHQFPLNPRQMAPALSQDLDTLKSILGPKSPEVREYLSILSSLQNLPAYTETEPSRIEERQREKEVAKERLGRLAQGSVVVRKHIEHNVAWVNGVPGEPSTFDPLHRILEAQAYRLAYWRTSLHEINYRRFFDINGLVGVRVENTEVFAEVHKGVLKLVREGMVTGLRLDHIDGLLDPEGYLEQLDEALRAAGNGTLYVIAEKILSTGEELSPKFRLQGTTGYDFLNDVNGLFVDGKGALPLKKFHAHFTGRDLPLDDVVYEAKSLIAASSLASELTVLANALDKLSERDRCTRDFTLISLQEALREISACLPVYRTYLGRGGLSTYERTVLEQAFTEAGRRNPTTEASIWEFLRQVLLADGSSDGSPSEDNEQIAFALKWQQYTGPLQAKGLEDTAFYRYNVLLSLNEVGGDPHRFGVSVRAFHSANRHRAEKWPLSMLATSTHDTKRGEDARCRIDVLSEIPAEWEELVTLWSRLNADARSKVSGEMAPDRGDEYHFYQALVGAWPGSGTEGAARENFISRIQKYMQKALREAKLHSSWVNNHEAYESATKRFIDQVLDPSQGQRFLASFIPFCEGISFYGMINSIAQLIAKITSPGVPDLYQGCETWNLAFADPDNRAPVDFKALDRTLEAMEPYLGTQQSEESRRAFVSELMANWRDGRIKHFLTAAGLRLRRRERELFRRGGYLPLVVEGARSANVVAFARRLENSVVLSVLPRLCVELCGKDKSIPVGPAIWQDTCVCLPREFSGMAWRDEFTGRTMQHVEEGGRLSLPLSILFDVVPTALLARSLPSDEKTQA